MGPSWPILGSFGSLFGPSWGYLGPFEAILGHLGAILGKRAFKRAPADYAHEEFTFSGPILGPKICFFLYFLGSFFGSLFCHFLVHFWGPFWAHFGTRSAQEGAKMSPRGQPRASRNEKEQFQKSGFRVGLSAFFRSRGIPREPQEAQEGSQEAPKELQNLKK